MGGDRRDAGGEEGGERPGGAEQQAQGHHHRLPVRPDVRATTAAGHHNTRTTEYQIYRTPGNHMAFWQQLGRTWKYFDRKWKLSKADLVGAPENCAQNHQRCAQDLATLYLQI